VTLGEGVGVGAAKAAARVKDWLKVPELPSWWRRKDKSAERRAAASRVHPVLIWGCFTAAFAAAIVEIGFLTVWCIRAVGDIDLTYHAAGGNAAGAAQANEWAFSLTLHPILFVLLLAACAVIVWFSLFWIPGQIALRGQGRWRRVTLVGVGLLCNIIILSGVVSTGHTNRVEDMRDAVVEEESLAQSRAQMEARVADIDARLAQMRDRTRNNEYAATAANVGAAAYRRSYMSEEALARSPEARRDIIIRALGAAEAADALEAERSALRAQLAAAPTQASVAVSLSDEAGAGMEWLAQRVDAYRPLGVGFALSLVGILGSFWGFGLIQAQALLDPTAPEQEQAQARAEAREDAETIPAAPTADEAAMAAAHAPEPPLDLPPLPDLRGQADPDFEGLSAAVDEEGRVLRRVESYRAAPRAKSDARRAPAPAAPEPDDETAGDDVDDIAAWMKGQAVEETETAAP
jgi:hypothetical protein